MEKTASLRHRVSDIVKKDFFSKDESFDLSAGAPPILRFHSAVVDAKPFLCDLFFLDRMTGRRWPAAIKIYEIAVKISEIAITINEIAIKSMK